MHETQSPPTNRNDFKAKFKAWLVDQLGGEGVRVYKQTCKRLIRSLRPKERMAPDVWADTYRYLIKGSRPGKWNTDTTPYMREPSAAFLDDNVETIVLMWSTQIGKTAFIENLIGAIIHQYPSPIYFVMPDEALIRDFKQEKLEDMFEATPEFYKAGLVKRASPGKSDTTDRKIRFDGGFIGFASSNSMSALAGRSIRYLVLDEVDRFKVDKSEGDVLVIAKNRTNSYAENRKIVITSTPTDSQNSRINKAFLQGDQRRFHIECPHCGHVQHLVWPNVEWEKDKDEKGKTTAHYPETAYYRCASKGCRITHGDKPRFLKTGVWIPTAVPKDKRLRSYHLNQLYSPFVSFEDVVRDYLAAKETPGGVRAFFNTAMAEVYDDPAEQPQHEKLFQRAESYDQDRIPNGIGFLTAGVDVQEKGDGRLEMSVWGWGRGSQRWLVDHIVVPGNYRDETTWAALDELRHGTYVTADGRELGIRLTLVDSSAGNTTNYVYEYCRRNRLDNVLAVKGSNRPEAKPLERTKLEVDSNGKTLSHSITLIRPNVTQYKKWLYHSINEVLTPDKSHYVHTPSFVGINWHKQLCAEKVLRKGAQELFLKTYDNEALDCAVYAHAAADLLGLGRTNWDILFKKQGAELEEVQEVVEKLTENAVKSIEVTVLKRVQLDKKWYEPGEIIVISADKENRLCQGADPFARKTGEVLDKPEVKAKKHAGKPMRGAGNPRAKRPSAYGKY